jgi:hypothetical protein
MDRTGAGTGQLHAFVATAAANRSRLHALAELSLDQTGRTGLLFRHSTARVAVMSAAAAAGAAPRQVDDDLAHTVDGRAFPGEQVAEKRRRAAHS